MPMMQNRVSAMLMIICLVLQLIVVRGDESDGNATDKVDPDAAASFSDDAAGSE